MRKESWSIERNPYVDSDKLLDVRVRDDGRKHRALDNIVVTSKFALTLVRCYIPHARSLLKMICGRLIKEIFAFNKTRYNRNIREKKACLITRRADE